MKQTTLAIGHDAEKASLLFLQKQGLELITTNYRFKGGEIDLIMSSSNNTLVFIEVRLRNSKGYGSGADSVTSSKQRKLSRTALHYMQSHQQYEEWNIRFDVISLTSKLEKYDIEWIEEAFWPGDN
ncbi:MAG: YraN family protein [Thiotrichales bacterium]|jgi:putative endonuclease|nr:YraN family protein [Thiotrichales bacterium]MBT3613677.1 YraN family protein [Thiotrichales bacterium]MBT3753192.1 YraN family protein [Thiotrichales bacterium]MBT3837738.1 YraN family protein [Thiotrichales bacterium]MBT4152424.1 YraN family protein [Thiotrichales bacterium]